MNPDFKILLVEDNPDDIEIARRALKASSTEVLLTIARDGQDALDYLFKQGRYERDSTVVLPNLILMDVNLPKVKGFDVLKKIKENHRLRLIPVVMLTGSRRQEDITKGYENNCNSFIQKPAEFEKFVEVLRSAVKYWSEINITITSK